MLNYRFFVAEVPKSALQFCTSLTAPTLAATIVAKKIIEHATR